MILDTNSGTGAGPLDGDLDVGARLWFYYELCISQPSGAHKEHKNDIEQCYHPLFKPANGHPAMMAARTETTTRKQQFKLVLCNDDKATRRRCDKDSDTATVDFSYVTCDQVVTVTGDQ